MKKLIALFLAVAMSAGLLAACGGDRACAATVSVEAVAKPGGGSSGGGAKTGGGTKSGGSSSGSPSKNPTGKTQTPSPPKNPTPKPPAAAPKPAPSGAQPPAARPSTSQRSEPAPNIPYVPKPASGTSLGDGNDAANPMNRWNPSSPYYWAFWPSMYDHGREC